MGYRGVNGNFVAEAGRATADANHAVMRFRTRNGINPTRTTLMRGDRTHQAILRGGIWEVQRVAPWEIPGSTVRPSPPTPAPRPSQNTNLQTKNQVNLQVAQGNTNPKCVDGQAKQTILNYVRNALRWAPLFVQGVAMGFVERVLLTADALRHPLRTARQLVSSLIPVVGKLRLLWSWIQEYLRLGTAIINFDTYEIGRMTGEAIFTLVFGMAAKAIALSAMKATVKVAPWFKNMAAEGSAVNAINASVEKWSNKTNQQVMSWISKNKSSLRKSANAADRGGFTRAGRSLTKHGAGARPGNQAFPAAKGNPASVNKQAAVIVDDILANGRIHVRKRRGLPALEIVRPDGSGMVYKLDSSGRWVFNFFGEGLRY